MRTSKKKQQIDRVVPGIGRITIRTNRMSAHFVQQLDLAIVRAQQEGWIEQLRMLKKREIHPVEFVEAARRGALPSLRPSPELRPLVETWLRTSDIRPSSRDRYRQSWDLMFATLGPTPLLKQLVAKWWTNFLGVRPVGNATLNRDRAALLAFLAWTKAQGHHVPDPAPKRLKEEPRRSAILTTAQIELIQQHCRPDRWPLFWTLLETGARHGEVLNVRPVDVGTEEPLLTFRSAEGSKGRGKVRHVPISEELANCLRTLAIVAGTNRVFPNSRSTIQDWWKELCGSADIEGVTLHGIRATFITRSLDSGIAPVDVQKIVGHSGIAMTMRYYRNSAENRTAAMKMRQAIGLGDPEPSEGGMGKTVEPALY